jgi:hypothetical protein
MRTFSQWLESKIDQLIHSCGHKVPDPISLNLGRGQARLKRITDLHLELPCPTCNKKAFASKLTLIDGTPYSPEQQQDYILRHPPRY